MNINKIIILFSTASLLIIIIEYCKQSPIQKELSDTVYGPLPITNKNKLSLASKRIIERNYDQDPKWFIDFNNYI